MSTAGWMKVIEQQGEESRLRENAELEAMKAQLPAIISSLPEMSANDLVENAFGWARKGFADSRKQATMEKLVSAAKQEIVTRLK